MERTFLKSWSLFVDGGDCWRFIRKRQHKVGVFSQHPTTQSLSGVVTAPPSKQLSHYSHFPIVSLSMRDTNALLRRYHVSA